MRGDGAAGESPKLLISMNDLAFNNRKTRFLFRDTMLRLIHSENPRIQEHTGAT